MAIKRKRPKRDCRLIDDEQESLPLSADERVTFMNLAVACTGCGSLKAFSAIVQDCVKPLLPHHLFVAVLGSRTFDHLNIRHIVAIDYPAGAIAKIPKATRLADRQVIAKWLASHAPVVVEPTRDAHWLSALELREITDFGLGRLAVHGQIDLATNMASYFSFANVPATVSDSRATFILKLIVPHLHHALSSLPAMSMSNPVLALLTPIERELLMWLAAGRTNWEIGELRGRSAATIRNQLIVLFRKMGVSNRAEAIAHVARYGPPIW
jgi:DNA-binding CsgD family transcriptional regulator